MSVDSDTLYVPADEDLDESASTFYAGFMEGKEQIIDDARRARESLMERIRERWGVALDSYVIVLEMSRAMAENFSDAYIDQARVKDDAVFFALRAIQGRALLTASEVYALLYSGHATGAMARWRTLHELACTAQFIQKHGRDTAARYLDHAVVEQYEDAKDVESLLVALGHAPPTDEQKRSLKARRDAMIAKYGSPFATHYGWAAKALNDNRPTFARIEAAADIDNMRYHYGLASRGIHAKARGFLYNPGAPSDSHGIVVVPSTYGLSTPAIRSISSLALCIIPYLTIQEGEKSPSLDDWMRLAAVKALMRVIGEVHDVFEEVETALKNDTAASAPATANA